MDDIASSITTETPIAEILEMISENVNINTSDLHDSFEYSESYYECLVNSTRLTADSPKKEQLLADIIIPDYIFIPWAPVSVVQNIKGHYFALVPSKNKSYIDTHPIFNPLWYALNMAQKTKMKFNKKTKKWEGEYTTDGKPSRSWIEIVAPELFGTDTLYYKEELKNRTWDLIDWYAASQHNY